MRIDEDKARAARDVGIEAVCEQQKLGGRLPSQREAEDLVASILPQALESAQAGIDNTPKKVDPTLIADRPKVDGGRFEDLGDMSVTADVNCATNEVSNVVRSEAMIREELRRGLAQHGYEMAFRSRFKALLKMKENPEWRERIRKAGLDVAKLKKILDDSNSIPGLGRWDAVLRSERKIFSGAGGKL